MTIGRQSKHLLVVGGLVLVLALLAHDVLMASVARAELVGQTTQVAHGHDSVHQSVGVTSGLPTHDPLPAHPSGCGTTGTALPSSSNQLDFSVGGLPALLVEAGFSGLAPTTMHSWREPPWPPRARRALLQVYRI